MRLLELKQRPIDKGLILIAANFDQLKPYIDDSMLTDAQREAVFARWLALSPSFSRLLRQRRVG